MTTTAVAAPPARRLHRPLLVTSCAMAGLVVFSLCAMAFDHRMLLGESVWLKPMKFGLAFTLYTLTLAWLLSFPHKGSRVTRWFGSLFAVTAFVDVGFIVLQAARGTFSHFNTESDAVNSIGQIVFASGVPGLFAANLVIALILSWQRIADRPIARAVHAGLAIAVFGMALGYLMGFTGEQIVHDAAGHPVELAAGHTVLHSPAQTRDGVGDMPLVHWSTIGGDLRIPHFAGLHGIQVLILTALVLARLAHRRPWLTERVRARLIGVLALGYTGLVALLLWQALRAQPLIHPDTTTLLTFTALVVVTGAAVTALILTARRTTTAPATSQDPERALPVAGRAG
ncbi:hypothetical protein [Nocardia jiangxiensis]|uniref:Uncharacterized protein n=1 Tax=Nocardia jiangxiensis TaxID=282685 RepID=A0ABW6RZY6_9NOCA|nr:hypothetical protein [Nocardia jiangxiensis]